MKLMNVRVEKTLAQANEIPIASLEQILLERYRIERTELFDKAVRNDKNNNHVLGEASRASIERRHADSKALATQLSQLAQVGESIQDEIQGHKNVVKQFMDIWGL
jgi:hypothetical protein